MKKSSAIVKTIACFATASAIVLPSVSNAALIAFTDRTTFNNAITIDYTEDFESLGTSTTSIAGPVTLPTGLAVSSGSNDLFVAGPGQSSNTSTAIGSNTPISDSLNLNLGMEYTAFGGDFFQNFGGGAQSSGPVDYLFSFYDNNSLVDSIMASIAPNGGSFAGFIVSSAFDNVEIFSTPTNSFEIADNITVGYSASVPEPTTIAILAFGLASLGLSRKKNTV